MVIIKDLEKLKDIRTYQPGEVYKVKDKYISMSRSEDSIQEDKNRYVLIVSSKELIKDRNSINVVSLTTSGAPDLYSYPLHKEFSDTADKFKPSEKSLALINFYQPIKKRILRRILRHYRIR